MSTFVFDIDGTLASCSERLQYLKQSTPDWDTFYDNCDADDPITDIVELAKCLLKSGHRIIYITGRPERVRSKTWIWLDEHGLISERVMLWMRKNHDYRQDYVYKKDLYEKQIKPLGIEIDGVFEDRKQCVDMWRSLGLTCYQVSEGDY